MPMLPTARFDGRPLMLLDEALVSQAAEFMPAGTEKSIAPCTRAEHEAMRRAYGAFASTYGEITEHGFATLAEAMSLARDDIFVDCGSGLGATVVQAAHDYHCQRSIGVEFAASRHSRAVARLKMKDEAGEAAAASRVELLQGDCVEPARWAPGGALSTCTCVYTCNVLFDAALNAKIKQCVERCPTVRCVACFERWPSGLVGFSEPKEVVCETSWSPLAPKLAWDDDSRSWASEGGSVVYVYERRSGDSLTLLLQRATSRQVISLVAGMTFVRVAAVLHEWDVL